MNRLYNAANLVTIVTFIVIASGCNDRPWNQGTKWYKPWDNDYTVDSADPQETKLVSIAESSRLSYHKSLDSLIQFFIIKGDDQREKWAKNERKNLQRAHKFEWIGLAEVSGPTPVSTGKVAEHEMVENVVSSREGYLDSMDALAQYLEKKEGDSHKTYIIHNAIGRFHPEETYMYLLFVELSSEQLRPARVIEEANEIYREALALNRKGRTIPAAADYERERKALVLFRSLIRRFPDSTRIPQSAFFIGEIYKEYFREHYLAVLWYKRAMKWDPRIALPVRFQIAVQYDFNLGNKEKALEYYRAALKYEQPFRSNANYSFDRIKDLEKELAERRVKEGDVEQPPSPTPVESK